MGKSVTAEQPPEAREYFLWLTPDLFNQAFDCVKKELDAVQWRVAFLERPTRKGEAIDQDKLEELARLQECAYRLRLILERICCDG